MELAGSVTVNLCVLKNGSSNSDTVILFIILPLNDLLFSEVDEISCDLVEGKAGVTACEHVCVEQDRCVGLQCHIHLRDGISFLSII